MKFTGNTYRPPFEASSLLLQVTSGCSHNRCSFCMMYRDVPFHVETMEQIESDLEEARVYAPDTRRVFLENGDPFVLSADKLIQIAQMIHDKLPRVETIAMYASIGNIRTKTDQELRKLRGLGINELNIGLESGLDSALETMQKGYTSDEALRELLRLKEAGIDYGANVIFGVAGSGQSAENAAATAEIINQTQPYLIFTGTIHADLGCPLYDDLQSERFKENTIGEYLDEEETFIRCLNMKHCYYFGLHPSNIVKLSGWLPKNKETLIQQIKRVKYIMPSNQLKSRPKHVGEGSVVL